MPQTGNSQVMPALLSSKTRVCVRPVTAWAQARAWALASYTLALDSLLHHKCQCNTR